ncbi:acyltransferase family protein [Pararhizobium haloflavum]|uniref:acyltransferase family protein n=1 Tax=Pararhizobium haloflavum TaxID=2037914 RepID=UPI000C1A5CF2|nr:acyltransferase family protein [Pararhizobium haloflavum]
MAYTLPQHGDRVDWVDHAKGISILLVVMMHSTLGVEIAAGAVGWLHPVVEFAKPFRMPAFFLISGLFLARTIDAPWRRFLDRKVLHFAYFYVLWVLIQFAFKGPGIAMEGGVGAALAALVETTYQPFGTLWFIYVLPVFFLFTRLVRGLPVWLVLAWAALLEVMPIATGSVVYDEFAARYVYFFVGYALAGSIFGWQRWSAARIAPVIAGLIAWFAVNAALSQATLPAGLTPYAQVFSSEPTVLRWSDLAGISLVLGLAGSLALVAVCGLIARARWSQGLRWIGAHSIVIYLAFFLPMAVTRTALLKLGIIADVGTMSLITWIAAVSGPVVLYLVIQWSGWGRFLFERPRWARLEGATPRAAEQGNSAAQAG